MAHIDNRYHDNLTFEDIEKIASAKTEATIKCECGHSIVMSKADRTICSWCGKWVYRTKAIEFRYKMKEKMKEGK